jgi:hypothetical protein
MKTQGLCLARLDRFRQLRAFLAAPARPPIQVAGVRPEGASIAFSTARGPLPCELRQSHFRCGKHHDILQREAVGNLRLVLRDVKARTRKPA